MTFLEYVAELVLGPPNSSSGNGESYWDCPHCGSDRFHTLPHKPPHPDKWKCWSWNCNRFGDERDLLALAYPGEDVAQIAYRRQNLQADFEAMANPTPAPPRPKGKGKPHPIPKAKTGSKAEGEAGGNPPLPLSSPRGRSRGEVPNVSMAQGIRLAGAAFQNLTLKEVQVMARACTIAEREQAPVDYLAYWCREHLDGVAEREQARQAARAAADRVRGHPIGVRRNGTGEERKRCT